MAAPTLADYQRFGIDPKTKTGGQTFRKKLNDPTEGLMELDIAQMLTGLPFTNDKPLPDANQILGGVASMMTPPHLSPDYQMPNTGNKVTDAMVGLGHLFQGGSGAEGILGGGGAVISQALGGLPEANNAMGTLMGVKTGNTRMLQRLPEFFADEARGMPDKELAAKHGGWFRDKDLQPKYEIPDTGMQFTPAMLAAINQAPGNSITTAIPFWEAFQHDALKADAFDLLKDVKVYPQASSAYYTGDRGGYDRANKRLFVTLPEKPEELTSEILAEALSTAVHETDHAVANLHPGWSGGASYNFIANSLENLPARQAAEQALRDPANLYRDALHNAKGRMFADWNAAMDQYKAMLPMQKAAIGWKTPPVPMETPLYKQLEQLGALRDILQTQPHAALSSGSIVSALPEHIQQQVKPAFVPYLQALESWYKAPYARTDPFDLYEAKLGEVNARTAEHRARMTPEELIAEAFWETRNRIYPHDKIIPFVDLTISRADAQRARPAKPGES